MFKPGDIVKITKLDLIDVFPLYSKPFKLEVGDICKVLVTDFSDENYPYFLRLGKEDFWISKNTKLMKVEDENKDLRQEIEDVISQLNKLLDELDNL